MYFLSGVGDVLYRFDLEKLMEDYNFQLLQTVGLFLVASLSFAHLINKLFGIQSKWNPSENVKEELRHADVGKCKSMLIKGSSKLYIPITESSTKLTLEETLVADTGLEIMKYLYPYEIINISSCCKELNKLIISEGNDTIWKSRYENDFQYSQVSPFSSYPYTDKDNSVDYLSEYFLECLLRPLKLAEGIDGRQQEQTVETNLNQLSKLKENELALRKMFAFIHGTNFLKDEGFNRLHDDIINILKMKTDFRCNQKESLLGFEGEIHENHRFLSAQEEEEEERSVHDPSERNGIEGFDTNVNMDDNIVLFTSLVFIVIHGKLYNITTFIDDHPGGDFILRDYAGSRLDGSIAFDLVSHSATAHRMMKKYLIWDPSFLLGKPGNLQRILKIFFHEFLTKLNDGIKISDLTYEKRRNFQSPSIFGRKTYTFRDEKSIESSRKFVAKRLSANFYRLLQRLRLRR